MDTGNFYELVEKMRKAQNRYFRSRSPSALEEAKTLEKSVDNMIKVYQQREAAQRQPELV